MAVLLHKPPVNTQQVNVSHPLCRKQVLWLTFSENGGKSFADRLGRFPRFSIANTTYTWQAIKGRRGLQFASGRHADAAAYNVVADCADEQFSASAWIYPTATSAWRVIVCKPHTTTHSEPYFDWGFIITNANKLRLHTASGGAGTGTATDDTGADIAGDVWTHVGVTYNGANATFFQNGVQTSSPAFSNGIGNTNSRPVRIGDNGGAPSEFFSGVIDDLRVWNRMLSPSEMRDVYRNPWSPMVPPGPMLRAGAAAAPTSLPPVNPSRRARVVLQNHF